jgi:tetratricopeptide (TPR) repeat protein
MQEKDAWNYGTLGDSYLELGEWDRAFDAFDTMVRLRPDAAAYARVAYARELQGDLPEALRLMRMAADATSPHDIESLAWHYAQVGNILVKMGDADGATREFARADYLFPGYPDARDGLAQVEKWTTAKVEK